MTTESDISWPVIAGFLACLILLPYLPLLLSLAEGGLFDTEYVVDFLEMLHLVDPLEDFYEWSLGWLF